MKNTNNKFLDCYAHYGLTENPFMVHALRADKMGRTLMVGRDDQVNLVAQRLHKHGKITCLDGHVGVGKTSLVNVAAFECFNAFLNGETPQLLIPLNDSFQLTKDEDVNEFCAKVFRKVANGLLSQRQHLSAYSLPESAMEHVNAWLNSPVIQHLNEVIGGAVSVGVPGLFSATVKSDAGASNQLNTSSGFTQEGLEQLVKKLLDEIFSVQGNGGVICVIDNLELLETGANARRVLEGLRDRLFNVNGLRWVFCGANGVIHSLAASPRIGSFLNTPIIDVQNIKTTDIEELVRARLKMFSSDEAKAEENLPIRLADISTLYTIVNRNLRDLLHYADAYCEHQFNIHKSSLTELQKQTRFDKWLHKITVDSYSNLSSRIPADAWAVLDIAMSDAFKGTFGLGDYGSFNANSKIAIAQSTFSKRLRDLIKMGLISKAIEDNISDDDGFKRDVCTVTAKGALVYYARLIRNETHSIADVTWLRRVHD